MATSSPRLDVARRFGIVTQNPAQFRDLHRQGMIVDVNARPQSLNQFLPVKARWPTTRTQESLDETPQSANAQRSG